MQRIRAGALAIGLLSVLLVTPSFAQPQAEHAPAFHAGNVLGAEVANRQGEGLGTVEDGAIDPRAGRVTADDRPSRSPEPGAGTRQVPAVLLQTLLAGEQPGTQVELQVPEVLLRLLSTEGLGQMP